MRWAVPCNAVLAFGCFASVAVAQPAQQAPADPAAPVEVAPQPDAAPAQPGPQPSAPAGATPAGDEVTPAESSPALDADPGDTPEPAAAPSAPAPEGEPASPAQAAPAEPAPAKVVPAQPSAPSASTPREQYAGAAVESEGPGRARSLYIRLAVGVGFPFGPDIADVYDNRNGEALHFSGYSVATDWMAGSAVLPWLVLGLGMASDTVVSGTVRDRDDDERSLQTSLYYLVLGGFADVYFSPPAGLHVQALVGLGHLSRSDDLGDSAAGLGATFGVGYELAIGRRWNVGVLGRLAISPLSRDAIAGERPSPTFYEPALLWTATFRPEQ